MFIRWDVMSEKLLIEPVGIETLQMSWIFFCLHLF